jgi:transitional endoplasmic reticulum ATPase
MPIHQVPAALVAKATRNEEIRATLLSTLAELGKNVTSGEESITWSADSEGFTLPGRMRGDLNSVIRELEEIRDAEEKKIDFTRPFKYRPYDVAVAFSKAMSRLFKTQGIGKSTFSMFGETQPQILTVETGLGQTTEAPWGKVGFSALSATFTVGYTHDAEAGICGHIICNAPRKYRSMIEGFFAVIQEILENESIYRGKAITGAEYPGFIDAFSFSAEKIFYNKEVMRHLDANIWTPIRHAQVMRDNGQSLKRAVLLEGPYGSGKSLAGLLTAQTAVENGWTYIIVRTEDDPFNALRTAKMYAPCVVFIEDLDILAANRSREDIVKLLDLMDSVSNKNQEVMVVFTTNFLGEIDRGVLRPGRIDAVIRIEHLDAEGYEKLVRSVIPAAQLAAEVNFAVVAEAYREFLPAFASGAAKRAYLYHLSRNNGQPSQITTDDLVAAAEGLQHQKTLMDAAHEAERAKPTLGAVVASTFADVLRNTEVNGWQTEVELDDAIR